VQSADYYTYLGFMNLVNDAAAKFFEALGLLEQTVNHEFQGQIETGQQSFNAATAALNDSKARASAALIMLNNFIANAYSDWYQDGVLDAEKKRLTVVPLDDVRASALAQSYTMEESVEWAVFAQWVSIEDEPGTYKAVKEKLEDLISSLEDLISQFSQAQDSQANGTLHHDIHYSGVLSLLAAGLKAHRCWQQLWLRNLYGTLIYNSASYHSNYSDEDFDDPEFVPVYLL